MTEKDQKKKQLTKLKHCNIDPHIKNTDPDDDRPYIHLFQPDNIVHLAVKRHKPQFLKQHKHDYYENSNYLKSGKIYLSKNVEQRQKQIQLIDDAFENPQLSGFWVDQSSSIDLSDSLSIPTQTLVEHNSNINIERLHNPVFIKQDKIRLCHLFKTNINISYTPEPLKLINAKMYDTDLKLSNHIDIEDFYTEPAQNLQDPKKPRETLDISFKNVTFAGNIINLYSSDYKNPIKSLSITDTHMGNGLVTLTSANRHLQVVKKRINPNGHSSETISIDKGYLIKEENKQLDLTFDKIIHHNSKKTTSNQKERPLQYDNVN